MFVPETIPEVILEVERTIKDKTMSDFDKKGDILFLMGVLQAINDQQEWEKVMNYVYA